MSVEEALDDWRGAARALGGNAERLVNSKLDCLSKQVAKLGSDVASQEAHLSAEKQTLSMHVEALEEQLLTLAKGDLVEIDDDKRQVLATEAEVLLPL